MVARAVFLFAGYVTSCGCMFNLFDGSRQREDYGRRPPPPCSSPPPPSSPRTPTITHASECKLPEAVNHFEKIPDSPRAPSLRLRCPFFLFFAPCTPLPATLLSSSFWVLSFLYLGSSPRLAFDAYVSRRTLPEKGRRLP